MLNISPDAEARRTRQPLFNLPGVVTVLLVAIVAIHAVREYLLPHDLDLAVLMSFAFVPLRLTDPAAVAGILPLGGARIWTFVSYAFLHADWSHTLFNGLWLAAFGAPLAWRLGTFRFLVFSGAGAAAGAALHLAIHPGSAIPLVGASAAISAHMAGAARFVFSGGARIWRLSGPLAYRQPALPLGTLLGNRTVIAFLGVWVGLNLLFGLSSLGSEVASGAVAWEAHIGGFLVGLFLFPLFDPVGGRTT